MTRNLYIFSCLPTGRRVVVARLLAEKMADGLWQSYLRYEASWLNYAAAFPLDPINLPLGPDVFSLKSRSGLWGVLEDALPDAWGRRLLQARHGLDVSRSNNLEILLLSGWAEPGAIGFSASNKMPGQLISVMDMDMTKEAMAASEQFEKNSTIGNLPDFFVSGGSSAGGARPKVLARAGDELLLLKFPSINDPRPDLMAQLEYFGLSCAQKAHIPTPQFFTVRAGHQRLALAVRRFDIMASHGRRHFLSLQSLIAVEEQLGLPYGKMAEVIKQVSVDPQEDLDNLFKQMAVNIIICNRDDHLKNFSMLFSPAQHGFRLSPAYDVVPNLWQQEHILSVAGKTRAIGYAELLREGGGFGLSRQRCRQLLLACSKGVRLAWQEQGGALARLGEKQPLVAELLTRINLNLHHLTTALEDDLS